MSRVSDNDDDIIIEEQIPMVKVVTKREPTAVQQYFREVRKIKVLSAEEEYELAVKVVNGDESARETMIKANLRLVISIAKRYMGCGILLSDLIEEGNLGLIKAVEKFDPEMGYKFSTYAAWWIRQSVVRAIAKNSRMVRLPVNIAEMINKFFKVLDNFIQLTGGEPSYKDIADEMKVPLEQVYYLMKLAQRPISLEHEIGEKEGNSLMDIVEDTKVISPVDQMWLQRREKLINCLLDTLNEQEKEIILHRFGLGDIEPKTLENIGQMQGLTRERIRQIEDCALKKLRRFLKREDINLAELL
jgi:RNA polymerase primary sigma factor